MQRQSMVRSWSRFTKKIYPHSMNFGHFHLLDRWMFFGKLCLHDLATIHMSCQVPGQSTPHVTCHHCYNLLTQNKIHTPLVCFNMAMEILCLLKMYSLWKNGWFFIAIWVYRSNLWLSAAHLPSFRHVLISPPIRRSIHIFNVTLLGLEETAGIEDTSHPPFPPFPAGKTQRQWRSCLLTKIFFEYIITHYFQGQMCFFLTSPRCLPTISFGLVTWSRF